MDLDPQRISMVRKGTIGGMLSSEQMISGQEDAASNYQRGYCTLGNDLGVYAMDCIRL
jgi:hypothetical protein